MRAARLSLSNWSFDFCAFSAEEYIPYGKDIFPPGSGDYVKRHKHENLKWLLNIDGAGIFLGERHLRISHQEKLPELNFDGRVVVSNDLLSGDDKPFVMNGIPKVWICNHPLYGELHTELDSLDMISYEKMVKYAKEYADMFDQLTRA